MPTKTVTLRLDAETYAAVKAAAHADRRSIASLLEVAAMRHIEEAAFLEAGEADEILADRSLLRRLRTGHADAAARRGRAVRGV